MVILSSGTLLAQMINVITTPIITRLYAPEQLGAYFSVLTIVSIFTPVINGRYDMAIVLSDSDEESESLIVVSFLFGILFLIIIGFCLFIFMQVNSTVFNGIDNLIYLSLPILLVNSFINILANYHNRHKNYNLMASVYVTQALYKAITQVSLGIVKFGILGLLISLLLSSLVGLKKQAKFMPKFHELYMRTKTIGITKLVKKYKKQPLYSSPAILMNSLSFSLMTLFINSLYSLKDAGYYSIAYSMLVLPLTLISMNVGRVFFSKASEELQLNGNFHDVFKKTALGLTILSVPLFLLLMIFAERFFEFAFGVGWGRAGVIVQILSPMFAVRIVASSLSLSFIVGGKQKIELVLQSILLIETISIFYFALIFKLSIENYLTIYGSILLITYLVWIMIMNNLSKQKSVGRS